MGVEGLTSYAKRIPTHQIELQVLEETEEEIQEETSEGKFSSSATETLVIDGLAWLHSIYLKNFPKTTRGGEYLSLRQEIREVIHAWRQVGIDVVFVFDGTTEPTKLRKALLRRDAHCFKSNETMSTFSALSRSEKTTGMIPPLAYIAAITNLRELGVEMILAEGEADGLVVEVAGERNGYAVSEDSDFFIFCSSVKGCKGYVPLGKMSFAWKLSEDQTQRMRESRQPDLDLNSETDADENDGLFISFNPPPLPSLIPSNSSDQHPSLHSVRFEFYPTDTLSSHFGLPIQLLPLFSSLCGNDFTSDDHSYLLFPPQLRFSQRMPLVSNVLKIEWENYLRSEVSSSNLDKDGEDLPQVALQSLIVASVEHLLQLNDAAIDEMFASSEHLNYFEEVRKVISGIWKGIESYNLVHSTKCFNSNPNFNFSNYQETDVGQRGWEILKIYNENYAKGKINSILIEAMTLRQWIWKQYLEDTEEQSTQAGACRRLRRWIYAIIFDVIGMGSHDSDHAGTQAEAEGESKFSISIEEYFRVGSNLKLSSVPVQSLIELMETEIKEATSFDSLAGEIFKQNFLSLLGSIKKMLAQSYGKDSSTQQLPSPIPSQPLLTRLDLFMMANHSSSRTIKESVPKKLWLFMASVRFMVIEGGVRHGSSSKQKNWKRKEIETLVRVGLCCLNLNNLMDRDPSFNIRECLKRTKLPDEVLSLSSTRTIHLNSSIQLILETNTFLAQALSLQDEFMEATKLIDGRLLMLELSRVEAEEAILRKPLPSSSYSSWRGISAPRKEVAATKSVSKSFLPKEGFSSQDEIKANIYLEAILKGLEGILGWDAVEERTTLAAEKAERERKEKQQEEQKRKEKLREEQEKARKEKQQQQQQQQTPSDPPRKYANSRLFRSQPRP